MWGRIVTILYATIGIPLCLLTLTNLGGFMATAFRFIYNNICCGLCCLCCEYREKAQVRSAALKYKDAENGDPGASEALTGISSPESSGSKRSKSPTKGKVSTTVTWRSGLKRVLKTEDNKAVRVPIYVSFLLIAGYILSGAVLFTLWEKDWDYLEGSYFCFITLSTIGFGDFVPGTTQDSWNNQQKLVLCAMYLIIGLSLIAMCFDLMQEEARNKVRALGAKLGLFDDDKKSTGKPPI
ncbi:hypothetical protein LSH36_125g05009 [Paralvinella palmiformis]|uniref:Potassium channel domain-containing protein n=1 Tax=Paralvinella palmiformis TaxID=53620 RepID=A0AAD9JWZ1_9ANNE|nr:hypothetical protein LSH36_125g05009 [Paralvinella palmiformis]